MFRNLVCGTLTLCAFICLAMGGTAQDKKGGKKKDFNPAFWNAGVDVIKVHARLGYAGKKDTKHKDKLADVYEVSMPQLFGYKIEVGSKDFETELRVEDASGKVIATHDTVLANNTKILHFMPDNYGQKSGVFRIVITSKKGHGSYTLRVSEIGTA